jgi:hypothetical protein
LAAWDKQRVFKASVKNTREGCTMREKISALLRILTIELEDLEADFRFMIEEDTRRHEAGDLSNYVCMENLALLRQELFGVDGFLEEIRSLSPADYSDPDMLTADLTRRLDERIHAHCLPKSLNLLIGRKLEKVRNYING